VVTALFTDPLLTFTVFVAGFAVGLVIASAILERRN
jgi:hypothetical protein